MIREPAISTTRARRREGKRDALMTLGLWALIMAIVLLLVSGEHRREVEQLSLETRITGEQVQLRLEACLRSRFALVQTLADVDWSDGDAIRRGWTARAEPLVALMPGVLALNFVDPGYVIRVVVPEARNAGALNRDLGEARSPSVSGALARAADGQLARTNVVELLQGGRGLAAYSRIQDAQGDLLGLVSGVFRLEPLMEACLGESSLDEGFQLALFEVGADEAFFANHDAEPSRPGPTLQSYEVAAADRPITMHFAPWPKVLA